MITLEECEKALGDAPHCLAFLRAWLGWRGEAHAPLADAVRPEDLGPALVGLSVLEARAPDDVSYRLVGQSHVEAAGTELKGMSFTDLAPPEERQTRIERARNCLAYPCGALSESRLVRPSGFETEVRALALPVLARAPGDPKLVYIALDSYGGAPGRHSGEGPVINVPVADALDYIDIGCGAPA